MKEGLQIRARGLVKSATIKKSWKKEGDGEDQNKLIEDEGGKKKTSEEDGRSA